jgi:hypothetical protein
LLWETIQFWTYPTVSTMGYTSSVPAFRMVEKTDFTLSNDKGRTTWVAQREACAHTCCSGVRNGSTVLLLMEKAHLRCIELTYVLWQCARIESSGCTGWIT